MYKNKADDASDCSPLILNRDKDSENWVEIISSKHLKVKVFNLGLSFVLNFYIRESKKLLNAIYSNNFLHFYSLPSKRKKSPDSCIKPSSSQSVNSLPRLSRDLRAMAEMDCCMGEITKKYFLLMGAGGSRDGLEGVVSCGILWLQKGTSQDDLKSSCHA